MRILKLQLLRIAWFSILKVRIYCDEGADFEEDLLGDRRRTTTWPGTIWKTLHLNQLKCLHAEKNCDRGLLSDLHIAAAFLRLGVTATSSPNRRRDVTI